MIKHLTDLRNQRPDLKVIASVGGYGPSVTANWSMMADDEMARSNFVTNVRNFIEANRLDGIGQLRKSKTFHILSQTSNL